MHHKLLRVWGYWNWRELGQGIAIKYNSSNSFLFWNRVFCSITILFRIGGVYSIKGLYELKLFFYYFKNFTGENNIPSNRETYDTGCMCSFDSHTSFGGEFVYTCSVVHSFYSRFIWILGKTLSSIDVTLFDMIWSNKFCSPVHLKWCYSPSSFRFLMVEGFQDTVSITDFILSFVW